ncbi:MAG TPA: Sec-independent protein translocase protein TatB [Stellaceae bacterium]|jgi:sec-independent protein translocase protein TatB|nr:Sec-independent protein translocase protein TatB [Stellaceae bacterium]
MFNFSWSEILLIGAVALVVIGPKDLPRALRTAGIFIRRMRGFAREFQGSIDQMVREAELEEAEKQFRKSIAEVDLPDLNIDHPAIAQPVEPPVEHTPTPSILAPGPAVPSEPPPKLAAAASMPPAQITEAKPAAEVAPVAETAPAKKLAKAKKAKIEAGDSEAAQSEDAKPEKKPRKPRAAKAKSGDEPPPAVTSPPEP